MLLILLWFISLIQLFSHTNLIINSRIPTNRPTTGIKHLTILTNHQTILTSQVILISHLTIQTSNLTLSWVRSKDHSSLAHYARIAICWHNLMRERQWEQLHGCGVWVCGFLQEFVVGFLLLLMDAKKIKSYVPDAIAKRLFYDAYFIDKCSDPSNTSCHLSDFKLFSFDSKLNLPTTNILIFSI